MCCYTPIGNCNTFCSHYFSYFSVDSKVGQGLRTCTEGERQHVERRASGVWSSGVWRWRNWGLENKTGCPRLHSCCVANRVLVLLPGVRPEPLRWESQVQDIGPTEISRPHVISIGKSSPTDLCLNVKTQLHPTASKLKCWTPHAKQLARQEHKPHPLVERLPKIIIRSPTPQSTQPDAVLPTRKTRSRLIHQNTGTSPLHQEAYTIHWSNLSHWGQTPKTMGTTNLQPVKRKPQTQ